MYQVYEHQININMQSQYIIVVFLETGWVVGWFVWVGLWVELINFAKEGRNIYICGDPKYNPHVESDMNITIVLHPGRNSGMSSPPRYRNKSSTGSTTKVVPISIMKYKDNVGFTPLFSIPSRLCTQSYLPCLSSSLPPFRNLDPGSHKRAHLPHLLHDGACVHFYRGRVQLCFFPRRVGSNCAYTLVRMTLFCFP